MERAIETIERNARSQKHLIEDLLDLSRIVRGKLRLHLCSFNPISTIMTAIEAMAPAAEAKMIQLVSTLDPTLDLIVGDPDRLQQIVWNLLSNAIKFTSPGGRVEVQLARNDSQLQLRISDTGQGISPDFLPYIFDSFRQAEATSKRLHGGLGLGLAIVRHLVELHGGVVHVESPGPGQGATFFVNLPLRTALDNEALSETT
jgi:signal transduction histidine kinase